MKKAADLHSNGKMSAPQAFYYLGMTVSFFAAMTVATIDTGTMNDKLHGAMAILMFVGFIVWCGICQSYILKLETFKKGLVSGNSLKAKKFLCIALYVIIAVNFTA